MIDHEHHLVRVQTPSGGELIIQNEGAYNGPTLYSAVRSRRYIQQGCSTFVVDVADT